MSAGRDFHQIVFNRSLFPIVVTGLAAGYAQSSALAWAVGGMLVLLGVVALSLMSIAAYLWLPIFRKLLHRTTDDVTPMHAEPAGAATAGGTVVVACALAGASWAGGVLGTKAVHAALLSHSRPVAVATLRTATARPTKEPRAPASEPMPVSLGPVASASAATQESVTPKAKQTAKTKEPTVAREGYEFSDDSSGGNGGSVAPLMNSICVGRDCPIDLQAVPAASASTGAGTNETAIPIDQLLDSACQGLCIEERAKIQESECGSGSGQSTFSCDEAARLYKQLRNTASAARVLKKACSLGVKADCTR